MRLRSSCTDTAMGTRFPRRNRRQLPGHSANRCLYYGNSGCDTAGTQRQHRPGGVARSGLQRQDHRHGQHRPATAAAAAPAASTPRATARRPTSPSTSSGTAWPDWPTNTRATQVAAPRQAGSTPRQTRTSGPGPSGSPTSAPRGKEHSTSTCVSTGRWRIARCVPSSSHSARSATSAGRC